MALTQQQRAYAKQRLHTAFSDFVDALRLRGCMKGLVLERITPEEWKEYENPTVPCPSERKNEPKN